MEINQDLIHFLAGKVRILVWWLFLFILVCEKVTKAITLRWVFCVLCYEVQVIKKEAKISLEAWSCHFFTKPKNA